MLLDLSGNILLVEFILLNTPSVGQPRCVEDTNLGKRSQKFIKFKRDKTYHRATFALKFIKPGRVGLTLVSRTAPLITVVEDCVVVVINIVANEDIGDQF